jgi:hypothetical protein
MGKMPEKLRASKLPDISEENRYGVNFASTLATHQFGRKQTSGIERLQARELAGQRKNL